MKKLLLSIILMQTISASAQEPIRCKSMTRWGQCTNEASTTDSLCVLHKPQTQLSRVSTANSSTATTATPRMTRQTATRCIARTRSGSM